MSASYNIFVFRVLYKSNRYKKANSSMYTHWRQRGGVEVPLHLLLTSALEGERSNSSPDRLIPKRKKKLWYQLNMGLVGSQSLSAPLEENGVRCLYGCFVYHIFSYYSGSILCHPIYGCMFYMLLYNFVNYVFFCYVYAFLLLCMFRSGFSVFILPTGSLRLHWLRVSPAFSSVVR